MDLGVAGRGSEAEVLFGKGPTDASLLMVPVHVAVGIHPQGFPRRRISQLAQLRQTPRARAVARCWWHLPSTQMRAIMVVMSFPTRKARALRNQVLRRWTGGSLLQDAVHLLVTGVAVEGHVLDVNAQAHPPYTQLGPTASSWTVPWSAVVHPDDPRQSIAAEDRLQAGDDGSTAQCGHRGQCQDIVRIHVSDREGVHSAPIAGTKRPLKIQTPYSVWPTGRYTGRYEHSRAARRSPSPASHQTLSEQPAMNRPHGGQPYPRILPPQVPTHNPGATAMSPPQLPHLHAPALLLAAAQRCGPA